MTLALALGAGPLAAQTLHVVSLENVAFTDRERAVVTFDPAKVTVEQMIAAVATLKYTATVVAPERAPGS